MRILRQRFGVRRCLIDRKRPQRRTEENRVAMRKLARAHDWLRIQKRRVVHSAVRTDGLQQPILAVPHDLGMPAGNGWRVTRGVSEALVQAR
jgi:hypothetical protein